VRTIRQSTTKNEEDWLSATSVAKATAQTTGISETVSTEPPHSTETEAEEHDFSALSDLRL